MKEIKKEVLKIFEEVKKDINEIENLAEQKKIYITIKESNEYEKRLYDKFKTLRLINFRFLYSYLHKEEDLNDYRTKNLY